MPSGTNADVHQWSPPDNLRRERRRSADRRHPRILRMENLPESMHSSSKFGTTAWGRLFGAVPFLRSSRIDDRNDPMLHHDGWIPSNEGDDNIPINNDDVGESAEEESSGSQRCVPMAEWQTTSYPNCNVVHEIDMVRSSGPGSYVLPALNENNKHGNNRRGITSHPKVLLDLIKRVRRKYPDDSGKKKKAKLASQGIVKEESLEFLGQGWFRSAWKMYAEGIPEYDEEEEEWLDEETVVLKTLRIERDFLEEYYELHRRDALAMERLTFSPYVLDVYGYCGQSAINELANFGIEGMSSLEKVARSFRGMDDVEPVSKIKLQLASMVAMGVSHMHSVDYPDFPVREFDSSDDEDGEMEREFRKRTLAAGRATSNATMVHYDLNPRNIAIIRKGKPKLNDFNVAEFLTWDREKGRTCGFPGRFREPWWRAPEEMQGAEWRESKDRPPPPLTEKVDIYSLGNILWVLLTTHSPRGKLTKELMDKVRPKVARGDPPEWPKDFNKTKLVTDPALKAIEKAMQKCLRVKPEDRPTAGEIAEDLSQAIEDLPEEFGDKEKWRQEMRDQGKTSRWK